MAQYEFLTTWCVDAPIDDVFEILHASEKFPEWWEGVQSVEVIEPGDADGIGELGHYSWRSALGETGGGTPTALDGLITEREFGSCGQLKPNNVKPPDRRFDPEHPERRFANCTGMHAVGSDLKWTTQPAGARCRLTVPDGTRRPRHYWDVAPQLFLPPVLTTPQRCPFSTDAYQLMRNLAFAHEWEYLAAWVRTQIAVALR